MKPSHLLSACHRTLLASILVLLTGCAQHATAPEAKQDIYRDAVSWAGLGQASEAVAVADGWISSMSGAFTGGVTGLGRFYGRTEGTVLGRHVFGYTLGIALHPAYVLRTRAEIIDAAEHDRLEASDARDIGWCRPPGSRKKIFFKNLQVSEVRRLVFEPPPDVSAEGVEVVRMSRKEFSRELMGGLHA